MTVNTNGQVSFWGAVVNVWEMSRLASACEKQMGLRVRQVFDLDEVASIIAGLGKGYLSPLLDPDRNDFTPANSIWLVAEDRNGHVLAGGVRVDDPNSENEI